MDFVTVFLLPTAVSIRRLYFISPVRRWLFYRRHVTERRSDMMFFFEYFLLGTALLGCLIWVMKVRLFRVTPIATRTSAIREDSAGENDVGNEQRPSNNGRLKLEENDGVLYESGGGPTDGLSAKRSAGPDESVCAWSEYDDDANETTDDDAAPRSDTGEDSEPSEPAEPGDGSPEQQYDQVDAETTNPYDVTACSGYGSTENDESRATNTFSNASSDGVVSYAVDGVFVRRADANYWRSLFEDESDALSDEQTGEPTADDYRSPEVIGQIYFANGKYDVKENVRPLTDIIVQDECCSSNDETNCINATGYSSTEIFDESVRYTEETLDSNSSSSDYRESLPSTINSSDTSINDIKYVEDIADIMFCKSDVSDNLNEAFIGE